VSFVAVLELMKRQLVGVVSSDVEADKETSQINSLTLQWLL
jgi:segregation and condensation protein A